MDTAISPAPKPEMKKGKKLRTRRPSAGAMSNAPATRKTAHSSRASHCISLANRYINIVLMVLVVAYILKYLLIDRH